MGCEIAFVNFFNKKYIDNLNFEVQYDIKYAYQSSENIVTNNNILSLSILIA